MTRKLYQLEEKKKIDQLRKEKEEDELQRLQEEQTGKKRTGKLNGCMQCLRREVLVRIRMIWRSICLEKRDIDSRRERKGRACRMRMNDTQLLKHLASLMTPWRSCLMYMYYPLCI